MLNLSVNLYLLVANLINFDPDITGVVVSFFAVCGKYGILYGLFGVLLCMFIKAATGKERFF